MDNNELALTLRRRNALKAEADVARQQQQAYGSVLPRPQFSVQNQGYSGNIGGSSFQVPGETQINWGDIIGKGVSNYMSAKAGKTATDRETELAQLNQDFMASTLRDDPKSMQLYSLSQAGLPGADKALAQHLAPKKEALAGFTQLAASGNASPELLGELATRYNIDPEIAKRAGEYARQSKIEDEERKAGARRSELDYRYDRMEGLKSMAGGSRSRGGKEVTGANGEVYEIDGTPVEAAPMTNGERQQRAKMLNSMDDIIMKGEGQIAKFPDVWEAVSKPGGLGKGQQVAQAMADSNIPFVSGLGMAARSKDAALLHDYSNNETLARMGQLGGNDSNEELRRMQASVPNAMQNPDTMRALLKRFDAWQKKTMAIIKQKRSDVQTGKYFDPRAKFNDPHNVPAPALEDNYSPQNSGSQAPSPDMRKKPAVPIDDWLDQQGIK